jgi:hypothetical protein
VQKSCNRYFEGKGKLSVTFVTTEPSGQSGRLDSNQRPPEPHSGALAKLRHAPIFLLPSII